VPASEAKPIPPRASASDYLAHAEAGSITIGAEFTGHSLPTPDKTLESEDFVAVEVGFFGPADARLALAVTDFSLRINGKKPMAAESYTVVFRSLKDPEWEPPVPAATKGSKTSFGGGGGGQGGQADNSPPPPVKVPIELQRAMARQVQKASLAEGDRSLPQAGLIFFAYRGKKSGIQSVELIYAGPAGKATLTLAP